MSNNNNARNASTNGTYNGHQRTARFDMPFDKAFPGSFFFIKSEPSRGLRFSRDNTLYRKAREDQGFFAYAADNPDKACCLMPEDIVVTVRPLRPSAP